MRGVRQAICWLGVLAACWGSAGTWAQELPAELAAQAGPILARYCARCHKGEGSESGYAFNVASLPSLVEHSVVVAGKPEQSDLFQALFKGRMPPRNQSTLPRPSAEEAEIVKRWIAAGAPAFPKPQPRPTITLKAMLQSIKTHFDSVKPGDRPLTRYFTLTHLHNDGGVDTRHLRMVRAALAKGLNSLSWEPELVEPKAVDEQETVYAVDLRQLGWTRDHWQALVDGYPYGLGYGSHSDRELNRLDVDLRKLNDNDSQVLHLRADWFVSVGLKPTLYHKLLYDLKLGLVKPGQQMTVRDLEKFLNIDVAKNIFAERPRAHRAGYTESGISGQNRLIERHPLDSKRSYWLSYDFLANNRKSILSEFPLGPPHRDNRFNAAAFQHDGGEIIFTLPNGLQGYLLINARGDRLDAGPIEIVGDSLKTSGNQLIVNGLSCIACHRQGMVEPPDDEIREFAVGLGDNRDRINQLHPEPATMKGLIAADRQSFMAAYRDCVAKLLLVGDDARADLDDLPEPVGETSRRFLLEPLDLTTVAAELYETDIAGFKVQLERDARLTSTGLGVLRRDNGRIKRDVWESRAAFSLMQEVARVLGYTPRQ